MPTVFATIDMDQTAIQLGMDTAVDSVQTAINIKDMEGVNEYLPCEVMTAKERAWKRMPKRTREPNTQTSLQLLLNQESSDDKYCSQVAVEQDSYLLMEGDQSVWDLDNNEADNMEFFD